MENTDAVRVVPENLMSKFGSKKDLHDFITIDRKPTIMSNSEILLFLLIIFIVNIVGYYFPSLENTSLDFMRDFLIKDKLVYAE